MLVRDWMTKDPLTVAPDTPVLEAINLLKNKGFRRLPVVKDGKLVGLVTDKDLKDAMPSKATTLSVWEMNYLLSKLTVQEVMAKPVITVEADAPLEKAALLMEEKKIGGLPVMDGEKLVGIITVTDVLRAFIEVLGLKMGGLRITVDIPDVPGALAQMARAVPPANIVSIATAALRGPGHAPEVVDAVAASDPMADGRQVHAHGSLGLGVGAAASPIKVVHLTGEGHKKPRRQGLPLPTGHGQEGLPIGLVHLPEHRLVVLLCVLQELGPTVGLLKEAEELGKGLLPLHAKLRALEGQASVAAVHLLHPLEEGFFPLGEVQP